MFRIDGPGQGDGNGRWKRPTPARPDAPNRHQFGQPVVFLHLSGYPHSHADIGDFTIGVNKQRFGSGGIPVGLMVGLLQVKTTKAALCPGILGQDALDGDGSSCHG